MIAAFTALALLGHVAHARAETMGHATVAPSAHAHADEGLFADHHAAHPRPCQAVRTAPTTVASGPAAPVALVVPGREVTRAVTPVLGSSPRLFLLHAALLI